MAYPMGKSKLRSQAGISRQCVLIGRRIAFVSGNGRYPWTDRMVADSRRQIRSNGSAVRPSASVHGWIGDGKDFVLPSSPAWQSSLGNPRLSMRLPNGMTKKYHLHSLRMAIRNFMFNKHCPAAGRSRGYWRQKKLEIAA